MLICSSQDHGATSYGLLTSSTSILKRTKHLDLEQKLKCLIINQDLKADGSLQTLHQYFNTPYQVKGIAQDPEGDVRAWEKKRQDPNVAGTIHAVPVNYKRKYISFP